MTEVITVDDDVDDLWGGFQNQDKEQTDIQAPFPETDTDDEQQPSSNLCADLIKLDTRSQPNVEKRHLTFGVGNPDFVHSVQLALYLKKYRNLPSNVPPPQLTLASTEKFEAVDNLPRSTANTLLRRNIIMTSVYEGYEKSSAEALEVLTDITRKFIERLGILMKSSQETKGSYVKDKDFNLLYKVLDETGFSVVSLFEFVKSFQRRKDLLAREVTRRFGSSVLYQNDPSRDVKPLLIQPLDLDVDMTQETQLSTQAVDQKEILDHSVEEWEQMTDEQILDHFTADN